ncbi:MAG: tRNA (guanosine(37)-N1)-methyltransferase TrmD [Terriglobia bacterium]
MKFEVVTIFPEYFRGILECGLMKRAISGSQVAVHLRNLRDFADDVHRSIDDRPFGGGPGMVFKPEPLFRAVEAIRSEAPGETHRVVLLTPQGRVLNQRLVEGFSSESCLILLCGRYEGVDERVATHLVTDEISVGDYVLSGGEAAAAVLMEALTRLLPGVLGNEESTRAESFAASANPADAPAGGGLLGFPQYTRPAEFRGLRVPEVLLSGNHEQVRAWRRRQAALKTCRSRPDLIEKAGLDVKDLKADMMGH